MPLSVLRSAVLEDCTSHSQLVLGREDLVRERSRMTCDVREAARRTTEEFEHKLKLQKQKLAALETLNRDLQHQV